MAAPLQHLLWLQWEAVCPAQSWEPRWESLCCSAVFQHIFASVLSLGSSISNLAINRFFLQLQTGAGCFRGTWALVISHCCSSNAGDCHENPSESNLFPIPRKTPQGHGIKTAALICTYLCSASSYRSTSCVIMVCHNAINAIQCVYASLGNCVAANNRTPTAVLEKHRQQDAVRAQHKCFRPLLGEPLGRRMSGQKQMKRLFFQ